MPERKTVLNQTIAKLSLVCARLHRIRDSDYQQKLPLSDHCIEFSQVVTTRDYALVSILS